MNYKTNLEKISGLIKWRIWEKILRWGVNFVTDKLTLGLKSVS
jgi:hypothetical protein